MKSWIRRVGLSILAPVAVLAACLAAAADEPNVTGTWAMTVESAAGSGNPTFALTQKGEDVTGTYRGVFGEAPVTGTLKGNAITMRFRVSVQGQELNVEYTGTVEGDAMSGKVKFGEFAEGTFKGARKRPS
jgi:hypothetical protein